MKTTKISGRLQKNPITRCFLLQICFDGIYSAGSQSFFLKVNNIIEDVGGAECGKY
jgi:hypothetical protein